MAALVEHREGLALETSIILRTYIRISDRLLIELPKVQV